MTTDAPTLAGFLWFIRNVMGITTQQLPDISPIIPFAYEVSIALTNDLLAAVPGPIYKLAVYNLGGNNLVNFAPDVPGAPPVAGSDLPFFENLRQKFNINSYVTGTISSASDEGTSESMVVPKAAEEFTLGDLQTAKTPWGRQYMFFAQSVGTNWGLT